MCDKTFDGSLAALKLILDWFSPTEMIKELFNSFYTNENKLFNEDAG